MGRHLSLSTPCCGAQAHCLISGNLGKVTQWGKEESKASMGLAHLSSSVAEEPGLRGPRLLMSRMGVPTGHTGAIGGQVKTDGPGTGPDLMEGW